ncbi:hypothetical protein T484DRAFT_1988826, partial [Baffinella frigidus]
AQIQPQRRERAQIKRNQTKRKGNSPTAPPRPFIMPRDKHVSILAARPNPTAEKRACPNQTKPNQTKRKGNSRTAACSPAPARM